MYFQSVFHVIMEDPLMMLIQNTITFYSAFWHKLKKFDHPHPDFCVLCCILNEVYDWCDDDGGGDDDVSALNSF